MIKEKLMAAGVHALFTLTISVACASLVYFIWYPDGMSSMLEGVEILYILVLVEVALGPLMSLVIYNKAKPRSELIKDYSIVASIQIAALVYGISVVAASRPVYVVFVKDRLEVIVATEIADKDLADASAEFRNLPWFGPLFICTESPEDPVEKSELLLSALGGRDIQLIPKYYRECHANEVQGKLFAGQKFQGMTGISLDKLPAEVSQANFGWLPVATRFGHWLAVVPENTDVYDPIFVDVDPYQAQK